MTLTQNEMKPREDLEVSVVCSICLQTLTFSRKYGWIHPDGEVHAVDPGPDPRWNKMHRSRPAVKITRITITPIPEE